MVLYSQLFQQFNVVIVHIFIYDQYLGYGRIRVFVDLMHVSTILRMWLSLGIICINWKVLPYLGG